MDTVGNLIDKLTIANIRIWMAEDIKRDKNASDKQIADATRVTNVVNSLVQKSGLNPQLAQTIASVAVPFVLNMFNKQAGAAQSSGMDIGGLISGALSGGGSQGGGGLLGGLLGGLFGGNKQSGGGDIGSQVLGSVLGQLLKK